jgi:hypothetical protein
MWETFSLTAEERKLVNNKDEWGKSMYKDSEAGENFWELKDGRRMTRKR